MLHVCTPYLPTADELLPWLRRLDKTKVYTNEGPLVRELESGVAQFLGEPMRRVSAVSNGTLAIQLALQASCRRGDTVAVPSVTYVATAQAVANAGLRPYVVDVRPERGWQMAPEDVPDWIYRAVPVAAYGGAVDTAPWAEWAADRRAKLGRSSVVVDAAGAILCQRLSPSPDVLVCFSLHATKPLGAGEGGLMSSANHEWVGNAARLATFGRRGTNAKMSEYHAAVALAGLDGDFMLRKLGRMDAVWAAYAEHLGLTVVPLFPGKPPSTLLPVLLPHGARHAEAVGKSLTAAGFQSKRWYAPFVHERGQEFSVGRPEDYPVASELSRRCLGIPYHSHMEPEDAVRVCQALAEELRGHAPQQPEEAL